MFSYLVKTRKLTFVILFRSPNQLHSNIEQFPNIKLFEAFSAFPFFFCEDSISLYKIVTAHLFIYVCISLIIIIYIYIYI